MRIGVLGINHKLADLELRELLAKICQRRINTEQSIHGQHSLVLLSTCNRTEVYFSSDDLASTHSYLLSILRRDVLEDFDQKLYSILAKIVCIIFVAWPPVWIVQWWPKLKSRVK